MKHPFTFIAGFFFLSSICADTKSCNKNEKTNKIEDTIIWKEGVKLKWDDFQSDGFAGIGVSAGSAIKIRLDYEISTSIKWFSVQCIFFKKESISRRDKTEYVLNHEQGHFDLAEVFARKLKRKILTMRSSINRNNYNQLDSVYHAFTEMLINEQLLYDKETNHSIDTLQQKIWDFKIKNDLDSLKEFKKQKY